jgi:hypothetical protein
VVNIIYGSKYFVGPNELHSPGGSELCEGAGGGGGAANQFVERSCEDPVGHEPVHLADDQHHQDDHAGHDR